nr:carbohydrate sulfotransferase 15-like [Lytechinus pictus]
MAFVLHTNANTDATFQVLLLRSGDISPNPGPEGCDSSTTDTAQHNASSQHLRRIGVEQTGAGGGLAFLYRDGLTTAIRPSLHMKSVEMMLYSHYLHFHYRHGSAQQFHAGVLSEIAKYESCRKYHSARACAYGHNTNDFVTLHVGLYSVFIRDWLKVYPGEQLLIYRLDEWIENCPKVFSEVLKFVELDSLPEETVREICAREMANSGANKKKMVGPMMDQTRRLLVDFYAESNRELSKLLGDDRYLWKR